MCVQYAYLKQNLSQFNEVMGGGEGRLQNLLSFQYGSQATWSLETEKEGIEGSRAQAYALYHSHYHSQGQDPISLLRHILARSICVLKWH